MTKKLLIIGFVWPEPKSSAAGSRMMHLIDIFQNYQYEISFATSCAKSDKAFDLESIGVKTEAITLNDESFNTYISELNPNIVIFDRFMIEEQYGWRVAETCPNALRILDTEDLHCLRRGRQQAYLDQAEFNTKYLFNDTAKREIASIYRCDLNIIISEVEIEILKHQFKVPEDLLCYVPFLLDAVAADKKKQLPKFKAREHFMTIGNFLHEPNYNSVLYLKEVIWPLIRKKLPKAEIYIYGAYESPKVQQMNNEAEGFFIKGFVDDVHEVMQNARVCLAPLRFGAGLKGKLIDAMLNGTPCVTTSIGAEGKYGNLRPNAFIEDDPEEFAAKAVELHSNKIYWNSMQKNGFNIISERFNKSQFQVQFINNIEALQDGLQEHRLHNFTGQMLMHHSLQSTKFMSKWIEEKNKTKKD